MILMREKCTSSRSRDRHGLFFMNKQRMCVWAHKTCRDGRSPRVLYGCVSGGGGGGLVCRGVKYEGTKQQDDGHMGQLIKTQNFMIIRNKFNQADIGIGRLYSKSV